MPFNERQHLAVLFAIIKYQGFPTGNNEWAKIAALLPGNPRTNTVRERFRRFKVYAARELLLDEVNAPGPKIAKKALVKKAAAGIAEGKGKRKSKSVVLVVDESEEDDPAGAKATRLFESASEEEDEEYDEDETLVVADDNNFDAFAPALSSLEKVTKAGGNPQGSVGRAEAKSSMKPNASADYEGWETVEVKRTPSPRSARDGTTTSNVKTEEKNGVADEERSSELDDEVVRDSPLRKKKRMATFKAINKK